VFDRFRHDLLPALAMDRPRLAIWVAGCGCGEEAYTYAMLLEESGIQGTVVATDIDVFALAAAERAEYPIVSIAELPSDLAAKFLTPLGDNRVAVTADVRDRVRFGRHDVIAAAAPPGPGTFAIVSCRNVLIYFQRSAQVVAFALLRRALEAGGVLVLGEAEWPAPSEADAFDIVSQRSRIFRARAGPDGRRA
ncbi:MAG TPA: CheR family methyltransferase, partial [Vicinamibacterales bacterium]